jgi:hypothetical protein
VEMLRRIRDAGLCEHGAEVVAARTGDRGYGVARSQFAKRFAKSHDDP